jgi:hypothetical protein
VQFCSTWYFQDLSARSCLSFPLITEELEVSISQIEVCLCTRMSMAVYHGMRHHEDHWQRSEHVDLFLYDFHTFLTVMKTLKECHPHTGGEVMQAVYNWLCLQIM